MAGLIELLSHYEQHIIYQAQSATKGLAARFKFCPSLAEIKDALDFWVDEEAQQRRRLAVGARKPEPSVPPKERAASGAASVASLKARFGLKEIPQGWDAVDVTKMAAKYGKRLPEIIDQFLAGKKDAGLPRDLADMPRAAAPLSAVVENMRKIMQEREAKDAAAAVEF
jgi:hypothetical protein